MTIDKINEENVVAVSIAECGAMGSAGSVVIICNDDSVIKTPSCYEKGYIPAEEALKNIPSLCGLRLGFFFAKEATGEMIEGKWRYFDMGFGNHLFLTTEFYEKYNCPEFIQGGKASYPYWHKLADKIKNDK